MWYLLNYIPPRGQSRSRLPRIVDSFNAADPTGAPLELFAPTFVAVEHTDRSPRRVERPLLYHYIFVRGDEARVKSLCASRPGFSFVLSHSEPRRRVTVDDTTMDAFRLIAHLHGNRLECYSPGDIDLAEGDKVQIVTGDFAGLTGTFIPRKCSRSGNIMVAVTQNLGAVIYDIHADTVRILEFAEGTRRPYDQMDAYLPRLLKLLTGSKGSGSVASLAAAIVFTRRFAIVRLGNPKVDAKLQLMLYASYRLLGEETRAAETLGRYRELEHHITNPWTRALALLIFGTLDRNPALLAEARALTAPSGGRSLSVLQTLLTQTIEAFHPKKGNAL